MSWEDRLSAAVAFRNTTHVKYIQEAVERQVEADELEMARRREAEERAEAQEHGRRIATIQTYLRKRKERRDRND